MTDGLLAASRRRLADPLQPGAGGRAQQSCLLRGCPPLLDPAALLPPEVAELAEAELALITEHAGRAPSPIMGTTVHYSQFNPRGHYTRSEDLERYFRAMMWYGLVGFELESDDQAINRRHTRQALLIARALNQDEALRSAWESLYEPVEFFVGGADDLGYPQYLPIAQAVFGPTLPPEELASDSKLDEFITRARAELPQPQIAPFFRAADASGNLSGDPQVRADSSASWLSASSPTRGCCSSSSRPWSAHPAPRPRATSPRAST